MSIDIDDLGALVQHKRYKWNPAYNDRYAVFTIDRNHIMHNKLIDRAAFKAIKESVEQIEQDLMEAIKKVQNEILSKKK